MFGPKAINTIEATAAIITLQEIVTLEMLTKSFLLFAPTALPAKLSAAIANPSKK